MGKLLRRLMAGFDPGCAAITRTISDSLDRRLPLRKRWQIHAHLMFCIFCRRYRSQLLLMQQSLADTSRVEELTDAPRPALSEQARERIKQALDSSAEH